MRKLELFFFVIICTTFSASIGGSITASYGLPVSDYK